ncbi:MAG: response regulator [Bacteroidales bacterium]|jgi:signal transduction histidine kinase
MAEKIVNQEMEKLHHILIVDDNKLNLIGLKTILNPIPVKVDMAESGSAALTMAGSNRYSLVLLDVQMPEMDGFETLIRLRMIPQHEFTPVILHSAVYTEDQFKIKGIQTSAVDFIPKPFNPDVLKAKVRVFLNLEENRAKMESLIEELKIKNELLNLEIQKGIQVAKELEVARSEAEKASEYKSQLLVNMSHEIRTPVNSILGFADLITNPSISQQEKEKYLRYVSTSSHNLLFLIDEILEQSRLEAGELKINIAPADLKDLCAELWDYFENIKQQTGKDNISLNLEIRSSSQKVLINTDRQRLRQVLSNLLNNAFKYTHSGQISFGFLIKDSELEFFVKDSGIGISPDDITRIFNRFKRAENHSEARTSGTGLGLSISKNLVELLGGRIWVESELDKGSVFRFTLPLIPVTKLHETTFQLQEAEFTDSLTWPGKTLLVAEDERLNFLLMQEILKPTGINILWATTGREAIQKVTDHREIDLVLMDIRMPDIDGYQATQMIRSIRPSLPLIILTAYAVDAEKNRRLIEVSNEFITKPINRIDLLRKMSLYLNIERG